MIRAVFLDRDGTLNREQGFVTSPEQIAVLPGVPAALDRLIAAGYRLVVVTNQSGIARGLYGERELAAIHDTLAAALGHRPLAWLHCPHLPDGDGPYGGPCRCRKPSSGLVDQAVELFGIDPGGSVAVGDSARDVLMARGAGVPAVLVRSGKPWQRELEALQEQGCAPDAVCDDLPAAVDWILGC